MTEEIEPVDDVVDAEEVDLDESGSAKLVHESARVEMHTSHRGPLPAPEDFERYDRVLPGAADRIMVLTETTIEHQQRVDIRHLDMVERLAERFLIAAVVVGLAVITAAFVVAVLLVIQGEAVLGAGIAVVDIIAAAIGFTRALRRKPGSEPRNDDVED